MKGLVRWRLALESLAALVLFGAAKAAMDALGVVLVGFIAYLFTYILRVLKTLDTPFRVHEHTQDDVSLFLVNELEERLAR